MKKVLIPGTFDPITRGHMDLIRRAAVIYDEVTVGIFVNPDKTCFFSREEREELIRLATMNIPHIRVIASAGYTADYAREGEYAAIIRGYRNESDLAYETQMAAYNRERGGVNTILWETPADLATVSSSTVRKRLSEGKDVSDLVPPEILETLAGFMRERNAR